MKPLDLSASQLAEILGVALPALNELLHEERSMTADMALRLSKHFANTPEFWMNMQRNFDLASATTDISGIPVWSSM